MLICLSLDQCLSLEIICNSFLILHCRRMTWECQYSHLQYSKLFEDATCKQPLFKYMLKFDDTACKTYKLVKMFQKWPTVQDLAKGSLEVKLQSLRPLPYSQDLRDIFNSFTRWNGSCD